MRILVILALIEASFLLGCSQTEAVNTSGDPASGDHASLDGAFPVPYFGEMSIEERIAGYDTIVRARLDLTTRSVTSEVVRGQGSASDYYYVALNLPFTVSEYLKGSGANSITVVSIRSDNYKTQAEATAGTAGFVSGRVSTWDDREAIIFINQDDPDGWLSAAVDGTDEYFLASGGPYQDGYSLHSRHSRLWLPATDTTTRGDRQQFMLAAPQEGADTPTITLGDLKRQITAVAANLNAGDGSEAYRDCVRDKDRLEREERYRLSQPYSDQYHAYEPVWTGTLASGQPAGTTAYDYPGKGWAKPADTTTEVSLTGTDASLFQVKHGVQSPAPDHDGDGVSEGFMFDLNLVSARPIPAGTYEFTSNYIPWVFLKCEGTFSFPHTATVTLPEGVLHELLFDPVTVGSSIAADDTNGVLKPASITGADGSPASIDRIAYEPPPADSGRAGTVKLAITAGSHPDGVLGEGLLDFIELDGSVSLSLHVFDATVDTGPNTETGTNYTLGWDVASQPWSDGDQLMVRIRKAPPSCKNTIVVPDARNNRELVADCNVLLGLREELGHLDKRLLTTAHSRGTRSGARIRLRSPGHTTFVGQHVSHG